jgi:hypothetical protein
MKSLYIAFFYLALIFLAESSSPYESGKGFSPNGKIDELQLANFAKLGIKPAKICSDAVFLRRVYLDIIGTLPSADEAEKFISDKTPDKRAKLIDGLLNRDEFAKYWTLKWCDILRVKSEFPINLWPNAVQAYSHWIWNAVETNMPYDKFARALLTSSGSNFRDPAVNFYRSTPDKTPSGIAKIATLAFLGSRLQDWPEYDRKEIEKLFSRISYKKTGEWKEEIVFFNPEIHDEMTVDMPDRTKLKIPSGHDPRAAFAGWLAGPGKKWFAEAAVNRTWFWLFGLGIVHEPDAFGFHKKNDGFLDSALGAFTGRAPCVNTGNPPRNPELLGYLADEFIRSKYDFRELIRMIANSATYQQSCVPAGEDIIAAGKYFAVYPVHRLDAEVLADALSYFAGVSPQYMSVIPEPFTYIPAENRTIELYDGSISSSFLETFGRSARDTGFLTERSSQITYSQRLFLLNSPIIQNKVTNTPFLKTIMENAKGDSTNIINQIYLLILSRYPSEDEIEKILLNYGEIRAPGKGGDKGDGKGGKKKQAMKNANFACRQLIWALINSKEFIFNH